MTSFTGYETITSCLDQIRIAPRDFQNRERAQRLTLKNATNATSAARTTNYAHVIGLPPGEDPGPTREIVKWLEQS